MALQPPSDPAERDWFVVSRWQEYDGERRANLLRSAVLAAFYIVELVNRYGLRLGPISAAPAPGVTADFHFAVTVLTAAWVLTSWGILVLLREKVFPPILKYITTALDVVFLTAVLCVADGPRSPLVSSYLLLICLAGLRMSLGLVRAATLLGCLGLFYAAFLTNVFRPTLAVPTYHIVLLLLSVASCGVLVGQIVRRSRSAAEDYAARRLADKKG